MFRVSLLEPYHMSTIPRRIHDPDPHIEVNGEHEYEMKNTLDSRIFNGHFEYLVNWHGYDVGEHIWELIKNISNTMEKVHKFH